MFVKILIGLAVLVGLFLIVVATRPSAFRITRKATIAAPVSAIFAEVNDFHKWVAWSPFEKFDPAAKKTYEGPTSGVGAIYRWAGNSQAGEGSSTITESRPNELVRMKLEFLKPFKATNTAEFTFEPSGDQTVVTWSMSGNNNFMAKAFGLIMNCDKMVGSQFEEGLANLRTLVERTPAIAQAR